MSKLIFFGLLATLPLAAQNYTISTFAGGGPNGVNATVLPVGDIGGVVNDSSGNCYFSSITLNRIFQGWIQPAPYMSSPATVCRATVEMAAQPRRQDSTDRHLWHWIRTGIFISPTPGITVFGGCC